MKTHGFLLFLLLTALKAMGFQANESPDYMEYHSSITEAETAISEEDYKKALRIYEDVFNAYDFVFLRDYKVASQLAALTGEKETAFKYMEAGIASGWALRDIRKNELLNTLKKEARWKDLEKAGSELEEKYNNSLDEELREEVHQMFKQDQKKALGALLRIGDKAQRKYGTKTFAPHSEEQMTRLAGILERKGYPGEKLIGNNYWMSTIISHHNSITQEYTRKDTLYNFVKPGLLRAIEKGEMSPYEFALSEDWQKVTAGMTKVGYGYLIPPHNSTLAETDRLRQQIGLRPIALRNKLVEIEEKTGMDIGLPDWIDGKIQIE